MKDMDLLERILSISKKNDRPVIILEEVTVFFGIMRGAFGTVFIWGPASLENMESVKLTEYRHKHHIENTKYIMPKSSFDVLSNAISIAFYTYTGEKIDEKEIEIDWDNTGGVQGEASADMERYQMDKSEMNRIHNSLEYENKFTSAVEAGDVSAMKDLMQVNALDMDRLGVVAADAKKQMEYLCVSSVILVSRAAVRGGMNPEAAYDLSDVYLQKIERCRTLKDLGAVTYQMQMDFTQRVHEVKERGKGNIIVEKCKDYVAGHLRKNFQVGDISKDLKVNRTYLSKIFAQQEGMTIQQYIMKERCDHAANMLRYTDFNLSIIAEYFCFSSQSHFGAKFREFYGMTPNEYRQKNRCIDSFSD